MKSVLCLLVLCATMHQIRAASWSYILNGGSPAWRSINGSYCNSTRQSPIDIVTADAVETDLGSFVFDGYTSNNPYMSIRNNGHGFALSLGSDQERLYNLSGTGLPKTYTGHSFHMHWGSVNTRGSEHTKDGNAYPAELHLVHYDADGYTDLFDGLLSGDWDAAAVLGVFIEIGPNENTAFTNFLNYIQNVSTYPNQLSPGDVQSFSVRSLLPFDLSRFWRYNGSLTIPNCFETVIWTVFEDTVQISQAQLDILRTITGNEVDAQNQTLSANDNYRETLPVYDRTVYYSRPALSDIEMTTPAGGYVISPMRATLLISVILTLLVSLF